MLAPAARPLALASLLFTGAALALAGCADPQAPQGGSPLSAAATKWLLRTESSYKQGDVEDARDAAQSALGAAPDSIEVKTWAARVYLARLEYAEAVRLLTGVETADARALRGRAHWYAGELDAAADDLDALLTDPQTKDDWAKAISRLARRGASRKPFQISGGLLAPVPMQRIRSTHLIVPIEIDGDPALALIATGKGEVVLDSAARKEPSWVQLRFAERITVSDVPALVEDLSGVSKEVGAPIKALLGVNLLRRLNVTFDFQGEQFVVRSKEPPPPPKATRVSLAYAQGGAMITRVALKSGSPELAPLLVNTLLPFPLALDERGWKTAGIDPNTLQPATAGSPMKGGKIPFLRIGAFDLPDVPTFYGPSFTDVQAATGVDLEGALGAGLFALFRCTFSDGGRALWLEDPEQVLQQMQLQPNGPAGPGGGPAGPGPGGGPGMGPGPGSGQPPSPRSPAGPDAPGASPSPVRSPPAPGRP